MAKFVVFAKRVDPMEARLRVFCMTDDREDKTLEQQEHFTEVAKSRDVEVLENKIQYLELAGNLVAVTKSGDQLQFPFKAFKENRLPFSVRVKDQHADCLGRALFMREPKVAKGEPPQTPICILNIVLPEDIIPDQVSALDGSQEHITRVEWSQRLRRPDEYRSIELRTSDISNLLGDDWTRLAPEIGISQDEIETIIEEYPNSTAQQAQAMLKLFQTKKQNDLNILENGLRSIGRDDIVDRCLVQTITSTPQTHKRH
jgi:ankyrin